MTQQRSPDSSMMAAVERLVSFMAASATGAVDGIFAVSGVTIIENFAPYVFAGTSAVVDWANRFRVHAIGLTDLHASFGAAQDFSADGERSYFSLPTTWTGACGGRRFSEDGACAFVLVREGAEWRVQAYGWAVTTYRPVR